MGSKITYLLNKWKSIEWSGPAWYSYTVDESGFPKNFRLEHFVLLDKGTSTATDWAGEELGKIIPDLLKNKPKLKKCVVGNIHSHHTMGAFFSGTDKEHLEENANKDFYPSLVVASAGKALNAFAFSYKDQYDMIHILEIEENKIQSQAIKADKEWLKEIEYVEELAKESVVLKGFGTVQRKGYYNYFDRDNHQSYLFNPGENSVDNYYGQVNGWGEETRSVESMTEAEKVEEWDEIRNEVNMGLMTTTEAQKRLKELNLTWEGTPNGSSK